MDFGYICRFLEFFYFLAKKQLTKLTNSSFLNFLTTIDTLKSGVKEIVGRNSSVIMMQVKD